MLDMLLNSSDELLPASGFLGFLVHHWLAVAIVILVLGFALDQLFYVLLDRPQDRWRQRYRALRAFLTTHFGAPALKEAASEDAGAPAEGPILISLLLYQPERRRTRRPPQKLALYFIEC